MSSQILEKFRMLRYKPARDAEAAPAAGGGGDEGWRYGAVLCRLPRHSAPGEGTNSLMPISFAKGRWNMP